MVLFEWDEEKNTSNHRNFFGDVLFVVYTERADTTRIISARLAEPFERRIYYGDSEIHGWRRV